MGAAGQIYYNPVTICQYALYQWELFLKQGDQQHRQKFLRQADWLVEHQEQGKWHYVIDHRRFGMKAPWISGMSQGQSVSVLLRAWQLTSALRYLDAARSGFEVLRTPADQGGVAVSGEGGTWIEEYPSLQLPAKHVMNGHVWALFGVWDMWRATRDPAALGLFQNGVAALRADVDKYDNGYWALYDQSSGRLIDGTYMNFTIEQLEVLHAITGDPVFKDCAARWEDYRRSPRSFLRIVARSLVSRVR